MSDAVRSSGTRSEAGLLNAGPSNAGLSGATVAGLRALVDPLRIRVLARALSGPVEPRAIAAELRLAPGAVDRALAALVAAGLVERREEGGRALVAARVDRIGELARALASIDGSSDDEPGFTGSWPHEGESPGETLARISSGPEDARAIRSYFVDGRLTTIPAQGRKRDAVLRFLAARVFTEDRDYPEKEVNQRLALFHRDAAALRRYLVDAGLVTRDDAGRAYRRVQSLEAEPPVPDEGAGRPARREHQDWQAGEGQTPSDAAARDDRPGRRPA